MNSVPRGDFRENVLRKCVEIMQSVSDELAVEEWSNFVGVLVKLGECSKVVDILWTLTMQNKQCLAYQLAVDLYDNQRP